VSKLDVRQVFKGSTTNADERSVCGSYTFFAVLLSNVKTFLGLKTKTETWTK